MSNPRTHPVSEELEGVLPKRGAHLLLLAVAVAGIPIVLYCGRDTVAVADEAPRVVASDAVAAGRYIVQIAGCNDCHTPGYLMSGGVVPEESWLLGDAMGWRGPWGTTYPSNLRLKAQEFDEDTWVSVYMARNDRPPMPWASIHHMSDADLRAVYQYLRSLGPAGEPAPEWVPPTEEPRTPYFSLEPQFPAGTEPPADQGVAVRRTADTDPLSAGSG